MRTRILLLIATTATTASQCKAQETITGGVENGGSSCTINSWLWQGSVTTEFMEPLNWFNCGAVGGPTPNIPIYIGPIEHFIQGVPQEITYPERDAILQQNFSNPGFTMANGSGFDISCTISNSTYTCPSGVIGTPHPTAGDTGLATLILDNSVWDGSLTIGQSGGTGKLVFAGSSFVTGNVTIGSGDSCSVNNGQLQLFQSLNNSSQGSTSWTNTSGAVLTLDNGAFNRSWPSQPADLINEAGATITKTGLNTSNVSWDFTNNGILNIQEGTLSINNSYSGSSVVHVTDGAVFNLSGIPSPTASIEVYGDMKFSAVNGGGELNISGDYIDIGAPSSPQIHGSIINSGRGLLSTSLNNYSAGSASWTNTSGAELILQNTTFNRSWPSQPADFINEAGATLTKTGTNTDSIAWDFTNNGTLNIQEGTLTINSLYSGSSVVNVSDGALFNLSGTPSPSASFELYGDIRISAVNGGGELNMSGDYIDIGTSNPLINGSIINTGRGLLTSSFNNNSTGNATWTNTTGAELILENATFNRSWPSQPANFINEAGATITKMGMNTNSIAWDFTNNGTLNIQEGTLTINSLYSGSSVVNVSDGAVFNLSGSPSPSAAIEIYGDIRLSAVNGGGELNMSGDYTDIGTSNPLIHGSIINTGRGLLTASFNNNSTGSASWTNTSGAELILENATFNRSWPSQPANFINEAGATITKTGLNTSNFFWDFTNSGTIDIQEGTLRLISATDPKFKSATSVIMGSGTLDISSSPALFNSGTFAPGFADDEKNPDGLIIDVPFIQNDDTAVLSVQVGSLASKMTCTGVFDVGGTIDVQRIGDIEPDGSEVFIVLEAEFVSGVFDDYFTNAIPEIGNTAIDVQTGGLEYDVEYTSTSIIIKNISIFIPPCSPADLNGDGVLNFFDVSAFLSTFAAGEPAADFNDDGAFNFFDVSAFLQEFAVGCP
ncbi:MAG: GC-type dockerin domain-anchored protein [Phycisphaerales bacterium]|nr:GC-type dockerin domain-anchored protein [Phycisphaerales bacterium]